MALPNIIQQINSKLPLSGGNITGSIGITGCIWNNDANYNYLCARPVNNSYTIITAGSNSNNSGSIYLYGTEHSSYPGDVLIQASSADGTRKYCRFKPTGKLVVDGNDVITSAGGTFTGSVSCASNKYSETTSNEDMTLSNYGINLRNSDIIGVNGLYFNDAANSYEEGINFPDGTNSYSTILATGGKLYFTPKRTFATTGTKQDVVCVTKWTSGTSWYRKYSDGWIEQGGQIGRQVTVTTNFNIAFTQIPTCICGCVYNRASTFYAREVYPNTVSKTAFTITNTVPAGSTSDYIKWYACGY